MSLRARMGLAAGLAVALAVIAVAFSAYASTRSSLRGQVDNSLKNLTAQISQRGQHPPPDAFDGDTRAPFGSGPTGTRDSSGDVKALVAPEPGDDCPGGRGGGIDLSGGPGFGGAAGLRQFVSPNGQVCAFGGGKQLPVNASVKQIAKAQTGEHFSETTVSGHDLRVLTTGVPGRGAIMVALPVADVNHALSHQLLLLILIAAAGIALAALFGILVARTALAPIGRFTRRTESIAATSEWLEHERLEVTGNDELARLARTFNTTLDALDSSVKAQRSLVADASHELRTPIASIRANLQLMRDEELLSPEDREALRTDMIEELDELTALVSDVVELARGTKAGTDLGDVRVDQVVTDAVQRARRRAPQLAIETSIEPTLVRGEGDRIARAVTNLLDNAAKWSPPGGVVEVGLHDGTLTVCDHGPGFHADDLPFVFDRFHRAKDARSKPGSGLGLAIVRQAAEAHGGFAEARNAPGGGALLRVGFGPRLELEEPAVSSSGYSAR
ncbi:MAG TPA: HAMP domain-containing sensor histidine kinase [Solirubrobacteraceae bacterium]|jgi:two-component system sensor histidine kinase MprB